MLSEISTRQFNEWRAYADLEPFDEVRADYRAASIVNALANIHRKKGQPVIPLESCRVKFGPEEKPQQTPEQARAQTRLTLEMLTALYGTKKKGS